ncbi:MAG: penicillin-binding protein 2 [Bdellovibrionia bacterium]
MKARLVLVFFATFAMIGGLLLRAAYLQILPNEKLRQLQARQFKGVVELQPRRGVIYDRNGNELASSVAAHSLYADPHLIREPRAAARKLSQHLGLPFSAVLTKLKDSKKRFVWLRRRLEIEQRNEIMNWKIDGLAFVEESKRIYPNEQVAAPVLGFVGVEGNGLEGLEARYERELHGETRKIAVKRDARGRPLVVNGQLFNEAPDGADIEITIDSNLQYHLEQELGRALVKHRAQSAVGVILDARTSEILAMSALPSFNPNSPRESESFERRNRTVTDPFEPGSTIKTFTIAAALKDGQQPNSKFFCENGKYVIGKRKIGEASNHKFGWLTTDEILGKSSNIGAAKIGMSVGDEKLRRTLVDFGFGVKTDVDTLGESRGIMPDLPWREHLLANISFGHGVAATPLQIANAYAAIANGGVIRKPYLVRAIRPKEEGASPQEFGPSEGVRILDQQTASTLSLMLMSATGKDATGVKARVNGFHVAGKTGTSHKLGPDGRYINSYVSSFAGYIPANDPRFVIFVAVDDPHEGYFGADVAAPVFSKIASLAVRERGLLPTLINEGNILKRSAEVKKEPKDDWTGLTLREALGRLRGEDVAVQINGRGRVKSVSRSDGKVSLQLE